LGELKKKLQIEILFLINSKKFLANYAGEREGKKEKG
jgi:hypothetical protein